MLSGDNAVVIALACRSLPEKQRRIGILLGAGAAVGLRIAFAFVITQILGIPFLKAFGGVLLIWIAIKLIMGEEPRRKRKSPPPTGFGKPLEPSPWPMRS